MSEDNKERVARAMLAFEFPFKCMQCDKRFKKKRLLREHKGEVHSY